MMRRIMMHNSQGTEKITKREKMLQLKLLLQKEKK
jgi:predicted GIY-YIG superfamily endonuclease